MSTARKNYHLVLSVGSDFSIFVNLSIEVHTEPIRMIVLIPVDEIL